MLPNLVFLYLILCFIYGLIQESCIPQHLYGFAPLSDVPGMVTPSFSVTGAVALLLRRSGLGYAPFTVFRVRLRPFCGVPGTVTPLCRCSVYGYVLFAMFLVWLRPLTAFRVSLYALFWCSDYSFFGIPLFCSSWYGYVLCLTLRQLHLFTIGVSV